MTDFGDEGRDPSVLTKEEVIGILRTAFAKAGLSHQMLSPDEALKIASQAFSNSSGELTEGFAPPRSEAECQSLELFRAIEEERRAFLEAVAEEEVEYASVGLIPGELAPLYSR